MELSEKNVALLDKMNEIFEQNGLHTRKPVFHYGGSDAAYITQAGIPCVDSLGVFGDGMHSAREYATLASLAESAKYQAAIALML